MKLISFRFLKKYELGVSYGWSIDPNLSIFKSVKIWSEKNFRVFALPNISLMKKFLPYFMYLLSKILGLILVSILIDLDEFLIN